MRYLRITSMAAALTAAIGISTAPAQQPADSARNNANSAVSDDIQQWHFHGKVSTVNPGAREITINADSIPMQLGGQTTLPYKVPEDVSFEQFSEGTEVTGDLVLHGQTKVINLVVGGEDAYKAAMKDKPQGQDLAAGDQNIDRGPAVDKADKEQKDDLEKAQKQAEKEQEKAAKQAEKQMKDQDKQQDIEDTPQAREKPAGPDVAGVTDPTDPSVKRWQFEGEVFGVNEKARRVTIDADSIPQNLGGETALPYDVPAGIPMSTFHEGDRVSGEIVLRDNRTFIENVRVIGKKGDKADSTSKTPTDSNRY